MPLVRAEVRNEYALGAPELYREAQKEDPKEILEGVAVAGLVGVLRQLGDLAEFAAEVFHGLQEEVTRTSSRSHKLMGRLQRIEAALSPLEKALLAQRSHLHFAYTAGSNWHTRIFSEQNHFIYSDLPPFIMDAYEDCRRPPSLHLLDKFDPGGPGSCLKRYSDPTFFKRASVASGEASTDKILKDKKGRKIKKRRSWPRNGKVSRDPSFSYNSSRMFTQLNTGGHTSPSLTASTYDATLRSDLGEQSNLDLRNGSSYNEGDFRPSYSVEPEELESRESISSHVKIHESDFLDYNFLAGEIADAHDDNQINTSQEQAGCTSTSVALEGKRGIPEPIDISLEQAQCTSSFVTWDKRRETLEPTTQDSDNDGMTKEGNHNSYLESFSPNLNVENLGGNGLDFGTLDKMDVQPCDQYEQDPNFGDAHLDDVESETEHFVDALNTIDTESETDVDFMKKKEAEHQSILEGKKVNKEVIDLIRHNSECESSSSESNVIASNPPVNGSRGHSPISISPRFPCAQNVFINGVSSNDEFNSVSMVNKVFQSSERARDSVSPSSPHSIESHDNIKPDAGNYEESVSSTMSSNFRGGRPGTLITDGTGSTSDTLKQGSEISNITSVSFWTNGSLLGLQPSKPPDFSLLNALPQDLAHKGDGKSSSSLQKFTLSDKDSGIQDQTEVTGNIEEDLDIDSSKCDEYQESGTSFRKASWKISPADLDINLGKFSSHNQNTAKSPGSIVRATGSFPPVNLPFQADRKHQENNRSPSQMFELSNRLLSTGSDKKLLPGGDDNIFNTGYKNVDASELKNRPSVVFRTFSGRSKVLFGGESPLSSPSSSPPLQHMKISFQPIDGFESSKLKLKFPDRNTNTENGIDIFPSFQLVPEVSMARYNVGVDSDADTFYRSSPSVSDDCLSNQSDSNSEQWETSESPTSKDRDLYDALRRISLTESVSTLPENGKTNHGGHIHGNSGIQFPFLENGVQNSESCRSFDLQSLDTVNHLFRNELRSDTNLKGLSEPELVMTTPPPPLPPVQWRVMAPHPDAIEDKCGIMPEGSYYTADVMRSASTISQPKPAPFNEDQIDATNMQKCMQSSPQKLNGQREVKLRKSIDETDFLHQIRTKSFSLRPIGTTKSNVPSGASPTVQVTAILEKANAIRQAVGSDGEDDGTWSDT